MKKYILTPCFTLVLLFNVLYAQTQSDLETVITATDNRTLTLENDIVFNFGDYGETLKSGKLSIIGNVQNAFDNPANVFTLTGSTSAFLDIEDSATLNLENIKLSETTSTRDNIITNNGTLNIKNSIISDNVNGQGSSVISNSGNLFIDSSLFENNTIDKTGNNPNGLGRGGVLRNYGNAFISNSIFRENGAQHGSALYNAEGASLEVQHTTFENNFSTYDSGYAYGTIFNEGTLTVRSSNFLNNSMGSGGAIYNEGIATIYDSTFTNNSANGLGGALTNASGATLTVYNSSFDGNSAEGASAAINSAFGGNLNIIGSTIQNHTTISDIDSGNYDRDNGGAIYFYGQQYHWDNGVYVETIPSGHLYIQDSQFLDNTVSRGGGAIYNAGYATIINTIFDGNVASVEQDLIANDAATAGAFYDYNQTDMPTIIRDSKFLNNTAYSAGAIYHPTGHLIIDNTLFDNNKAIAVGSAGALQNGGANSYLDITNSTFSNNYAGHGGGIFHQSKNAMNITNTVFDGNIAESFGGAFYAYTHEIVKGQANTAVQNYTNVTSSTFQNNNAGRGGAIYALSKVDVIDSLFENNTADGGGAIYVGSDNYYSGIVTVNNSSFIGNSAGNGGAISNTGTLTITDSIFKKNIGASGSAIFSNGDVNIYNSVFTNNISTYSTDYTYATGTGVIDGNGTINVFNSLIINNYHSSNNTNDYSGAITGRGTVNIIANNGVSMFSGNVSSGNSSSLFVRSNSEMSLFAGNNGTITINDAITLNSGSYLNINKENNQDFANDGIVEINDEVNHVGGAYNSEFHVNLYNGTLKFGSATVNYDINGDGVGDGDVTSHGMLDDRVSLNIYGGKLSTVDSLYRNTNIGNVNLYSNVLYDFNVDLENKTTDTLTASSFESNGYNFLIDTIYLKGDTDAVSTEIYIKNDSLDLQLSDQTVAAYTQMYRYELDDSKLSSEGSLTFTKDLDTYRGYNPSLYAHTVSLLAGNIVSNFSVFSKSLRNLNSDLKSSQLKIIPYFSTEKMSITEGHEVNNMQYGSHLSYSFNPSVAITMAYSGSYQTYEKTSLFQNGGSIAFQHSLVMDTFFMHSMIHGMGSYSAVKTMYGNDSFPTISTGLASNVGYAFRLFDNTVIVKPGVMVSYTFAKAFDYVNTSGITLKTKGLHVASVYPSIQLIKKIDDDLRIYAQTKGVFPFMFGGQTNANEVSIPTSSLSTYIEYGLGLEKQVENDFSVEAAISGYALSRMGIDIHLCVSYSF